MASCRKVARRCSKARSFRARPHSTGRPACWRGQLQGRAGMLRDRLGMGRHPDVIDGNWGNRSPRALDNLRRTHDRACISWWKKHGKAMLIFEEDGLSNYLRSWNCTIAIGTIVRSSGKFFFIKREINEKLNICWWSVRNAWFRKSVVAIVRLHETSKRLFS